jgi:hypothetical protein
MNRNEIMTLQHSLLERCQKQLDNEQIFPEEYSGNPHNSGPVQLLIVTKDCTNSNKYLNQLNAKFSGVYSQDCDVSVDEH